MRKLKNITLLVMAFLTVICAVGCNDSNNDNNSTEPGKTMAFTADTQSPPDNSVSLRFVSYSGDDMILEVYAKKITNVYGAAFALHFEPTVFEYIGATEGNLFNADGRSTAFMAAGGTGVVTIGCSLLGSETQVISGSGPICSLIFRAVENGQSPFKFREQRLFDDTGSEIADVKWYGGLGNVND